VLPIVLSVSESNCAAILLSEGKVDDIDDDDDDDDDDDNDAAEDLMLT
jgi:hypothetical protein